MTIKTLTFIHESLKDEVNRRLDTKKYVYDLWEEAVEQELPTAEHIREQYNIAREKYNEAHDALEDFEQQDW